MIENMNDERESYSDLDNPCAHLAHLPRQQRRAAMRAEAKAKRQSITHQVKLADHDGMPLATSAECLADPLLRSTNTFRKECFRSRERVFVPTATKKPGRPVRKISEMNFSQLGRTFRRSYAKRFHHIPKMFKRITGTDENAEKLRAFLSSAINAHDQQIIRVNAEIAKRHSKHIAEAGRAITEARAW